jgi:hypothetical protein
MWFDLETSAKRSSSSNHYKPSSVAKQTQIDLRRSEGAFAWVQIMVVEKWIILCTAIIRIMGRKYMLRHDVSMQHGLVSSEVHIGL